MSYVLVIKERFKIFPNNRKQLNPSPSNYQRPKHSWKFPENSWSAKNCIYCLIECNGVLTQCDSSQRAKYAAEYALQRAILASSIHYCTLIIISSHLLTWDWAHAALVPHPPLMIMVMVSSTSEYLIVSYDADDAILSYNCIAPPPTVVHQPVLRESPLLLNTAPPLYFIDLPKSFLHQWNTSLNHQSCNFSFKICTNSVSLAISFKTGHQQWIAKREAGSSWWSRCWSFV